MMSSSSPHHLLQRTNNSTICLSRKTSPEVSKGKTASVHRPQWLWSISGDVQIETQKSIARACKARPATRPGVVKKILTLRTGDVAQLVACWPSMHKASHKTRHGGTCFCNPRTQKVKARGPEFQGHYGLHRVSEASLGYKETLLIKNSH